MIRLILLWVGLAAALAGEEPEVEVVGEKVYSWKEVSGGMAFLKTVQETYPDARLGFFCGDYGSMHGVFEDFENSRIFYFPGSGDYDSLKIHRNGELQSLPYGKAVEIRIADQTLSSDGNLIDEETSSHTVTLGCWIELEATDSFRMKFGFPNSLDGVVEIFYNPDSRWRVSKSWDEEKIPNPADAYEISCGSLLERVGEVVAIQKKCLVRLESGIDLEMVKASEEDEKLGIKPLVFDLRLGKKLEGKRDMEWEDISTYCDGSRAAGVEPLVHFKVEAESKDELFRRALNEAGNCHVRRVQLEWVEE